MTACTELYSSRRIRERRVPSTPSGPENRHRRVMVDLRHAQFGRSGHGQQATPEGSPRQIATIPALEINSASPAALAELTLVHILGLVRQRRRHWRSTRGLLTDEGAVCAAQIEHKLGTYFMQLKSRYTAQISIFVTSFELCMAMALPHEIVEVRARTRRWHWFRLQSWIFFVQGVDLRALFDNQGDRSRRHNRKGDRARGKVAPRVSLTTTLATVIRPYQNPDEISLQP